MTVYAAGALLWREEQGKLLLAVVQRTRYNDFAWPKGKLDPGEVLPQTAVREILEETGLRIRLGVKLPVQHYKLPSGEPKEVHYWAAKVTQKALKESKFKPDEEVAAVHWWTPEECIEKLTYGDDKLYVQEILDRFRDETLRTRTLILVRHAKATPRSAYKGGNDGKRPLLPFGKQQAKSLIPLLGAWGPKRIISSPWTRCLTTVLPYAESRGLPVIERHQLSELGNAKGPARTKNVVRDIVESGKASVLCSHRPALPSILDELAKYGTPNQEILLHEGRALKPGHLMVVHFTIPSDKDKPRRIAAIEQYAPFLAEEPETGS